jgi:hypothetical protein
MIMLIAIKSPMVSHQNHRTYLATVDNNDTVSKGFHLVSPQNETMAVEVKPCLSVRQTGSCRGNDNRLFLI